MAHKPSIILTAAPQQQAQIAVPAVSTTKVKKTKKSTPTTRK